MSRANQTVQWARARTMAGFSLLEMLVALVILLAVTAVVMSGIIQMAMAEGSIANRTEMHASARSATELLQQEVGQAGRVALPEAVTLGAAVSAIGSQTVTVSSASGSPTSAMFVGEQLLVDVGSSQETVAITTVNSSTQITAQFAKVHPVTTPAAPVSVAGGFGTGIVPPAASPYSMTNGSTGNVLKLYGDINSDGNMLYIEYSCDTTRGNLYRNVMSFTAGTKPSIAGTAGDPMILLPIAADGSACFTYQTLPSGCVGSACYVVDVAVTLTVQTAMKDPQTGLYQTETKALLNVSPRNVFEVWQLASASITTRTQPMPATVTALLP